MQARGTIRVYNAKGEILDKHTYVTSEHRKQLIKMWSTEYDWNIAYFQVNPSIVINNLTRDFYISRLKM